MDKDSSRLYGINKSKIDEVENKGKKYQANKHALRAKELATDGELERALELMKKCHSLRCEINDKEGIIRNLLSMAKIYYLLGDIDKSQDLAMQGMNVITQLKEETGYYHPLLDNFTAFLTKFDQELQK